MAVVKHKDGPKVRVNVILLAFALEDRGVWLGQLDGLACAVIRDPYHYLEMRVACCCWTILRGVLFRSASISVNCSISGLQKKKQMWRRMENMGPSRRHDEKEEAGVR